MNELLTPSTLELLIRKSPGSVAVFNLNMEYMHVSEKWIIDFNLQNQSIIGKSHYEVFPEILNNPEWLDLHKRALAGETITQTEEYWERAHGKEFLQYEISPWKKEDGQIGGIIMFVQVLTNSKKIEQRLLEQEEVFSKFMKLSPIGIALLHCDGRWMEINDALCDFLGYEKQELLKTNFQNVTYPEDLGIDLENVADLLSGKQNSYLLEKRYVSKKGKVLWALLSATLLRDQAGNPSFFLSQIVDITALKEGDRIRENFISHVSHELKTPLTSLILALEFLGGTKQQKTPPALYEKYIMLAQKSGFRLTSLVNDIVDAEKLQTDEFTYSMEKTKVSRVLQNVIVDLGTIIETYGVVLEYMPHEDLHILVDQDRFSQIITNFLTNAMRFTPKGGSIVIHVKALSGKVVVCVTDTGPGIPREFRQNIFKRFAREDNPINRKENGTGLGLYISKQMVEAMNGEIGFETTQEGTTFWCKFLSI